MLRELTIRDFAIIDDLHLQFGAGLNILTGETGAGKSIIIDAIGLLLGDRAADEWVRSGREIAQIEAVFSLDHNGDLTSHIRQILEEEGLDDPESDDWIILGREVRKNGRNICRVNGRTVSLQLLSQISSHLIDVHGQGEHLSLLQPRTHIHLLDRYAGLLEERARIGQKVGTLRKVRADLKRMRDDARTVAQRLDLLNFQVEEITEARLRPGEDEDLDHERSRLSNAETLLQLAQTAQTMLSEGESELPSAIDLLSEATGRIERLARIDGAMQETADEAQGLLEQLSELSRTLEDYADRLEFNPERLVEVEDRLELIANLKRKYGDTIPQIIAFGDNAIAELDNLSTWETQTAKLEDEEESLLQEIGAAAFKLSSQRVAAGEQLARQVEQELAELRMERAQFGVSLRQAERRDGAYWPNGTRVAFDETGADQIEFLISANPGEPLKPMARVASGGETARLMLALKSVLAHADATPTLIFDEIDQGIGGRVGGIVGRKLWRLTGSATDEVTTAPVRHQILCITHLPQLAAYGDQHFTVKKRITTENGADRTHTIVQNLSGEERINELVQMLGAPSASGRKSVEEMLADVQKVKAGE